MPNPSPVRPEFSRPLALEALGPGEVVRRIEAAASERAALAARFGLLALERLSAELRLRRLAGGAVRVRGRLVAEVVQQCVVSLAPVAARLEEPIAALFSPGLEAAGEVVLAPEEEEIAEPLSGESLDLGELVAQSLGVALDPYPRAPGAEIPAAYRAGRPAGPEAGPFAPLARLARRRPGR